MTQRLNSIFATSKELHQLSGKVRQLRAYQLYYEQVAPPSILRASSILQIENDTLTIAANNGAIASKLRQMLPELLSQLQQKGCEITGIHVKVQVTIPLNTRVVSPISISKLGQSHLNEFADTLSDSPLKSALERLAKKRSSK